MKQTQATHNSYSRKTAEIGMDYASMDPPYFDPQFPPIHFPFTYMSQGKAIQSFMWLAGNNDPKGCVILSPQLNGGDCLDSLIPPLLSAGINVMRFNPRGMWDNEQEYSIMAHFEDLQAAIASLRQNGGQHNVPLGAGPSRPYQIDLERIAILGKSGGGGLNGLITASENPHLNTVVAVHPAIMRTLPAHYADEFAGMKVATAGRIDTGKWVAELTPADRDRLDVFKAAPRLVDKNVLLVGSLDEDYLQNIHRPIVQAMTNAGAKHFTEVVLEAANEYFLTKRIALARLVISWLKIECGF